MKEKNKKPIYRKWWFIVIVIIVALSASSCGGDKESKEVKNIKYRVVEKGDISYANVKRPFWEVVVEEKVSIEALQDLSKELIEQAKKEEKFNAIVIGFYDYEEYIGTGYTLGKVEYAPDGDWSKANTVRAGDYKKMDYKYNLMAKDWDMQLTKKEVSIYKEWKDLLEANEELEEDVATKEVAERNDITTKEVDDILFKWVMWASNDLSK